MRCLRFRVGAKLSNGSRRWDLALHATEYLPNRHATGHSVHHKERLDQPKFVYPFRGNQGLEVPACVPSCIFHKATIQSSRRCRIRSNALSSAGIGLAPALGPFNAWEARPVLDHNSYPASAFLVANPSNSRLKHDQVQVQVQVFTQRPRNGRIKLCKTRSRTKNHGPFGGSSEEGPLEGSNKIKLKVYREAGWASAS